MSTIHSHLHRHRRRHIGRWQLLSLATALACSSLAAFSASKPTYAHKMEMGQLLYFNGDVDRAINEFLEAAELNPKSFEPHLNLINLYMGKGNDLETLEKAAHECHEVLDRKPNNRDVHLILGNLLRTEAGMVADVEAQKKKLTEAMTEVGDAEKLGANQPMCEYTIGMIKMQLGDNAGGLVNIDEAVKKQNHFADAHLIRGILLFKTINAIAGKPPDAQLVAADLALPAVKKQIDDVLAELDLAVEQKNGVNTEALNTKADILFSLGRIVEARDNYRKAAGQQATYLQAWAGLGNCEAQLAAQETDDKKKAQHLAAARDAYIQAKKLKPDDKNIVYGLAMMLEKMGQSEDAAHEYQDGLLLETDPLMKAQITMHIQQLVGNNIGKIGDFNTTTNVPTPGSGIFNNSDLNQPFANLIRIKPPAGSEEKTAQ